MTEPFDPATWPRAEMTDEEWREWCEALDIDPDISATDDD